MPKKKKVPVEELIVPPQDHRICGMICICQMTAILSSVAMVYLSVAIYFPSFRAFYSGILQEPAMCSTSKVINAEKCTWGSCGEWCLSKTSGACLQIHVNLRRNGSNLAFSNCSNSFNKTCYGIDMDNVKKYRCKQEECKDLSGTFNCTSGTCVNITDVFECVFHSTDRPLTCSGQRGKLNCMDIEGLNSCKRGNCARIRTPYNCDRRCVDIPTYNKNVILLSGDRVFLSYCQHGKVDDDDVSVMRPLVEWHESETTALLASCYTVVSYATEERLYATDCINGTLIDKNVLSDLSNFTFLYYLTVANETARSELERDLAPPEPDLLIANDSRLQINLEGCVNTLRDECKEFTKEYGKDGADHNARARFPCYFSEQDTSMVVARFDLNTAYTEFIFATIIPIVLLVVSCTTLIFCQRTVEVGDDAKMRFKRKLPIPIPLVVTTPDKDTINDKGGGGSHDRHTVPL